MSEENNSNTNQPDRRKRNYRHFGPADTNGKSDSARTKPQERSSGSGSDQQTSGNQQPSNRGSADKNRSSSQNNRGRRKPRSKSGRNRNPRQRPQNNQRSGLSDESGTASKQNESRQQGQSDQNKQTNQIKENTKPNLDRKKKPVRGQQSAQPDQQSGSTESTSRKRIQRNVNRQDKRDAQNRQDQNRSEINRKSADARRERWQKKIKTEETAEDIKKDNERIEKEIWLEIASIHTIKLD